MCIESEYIYDDPGYFDENLRDAVFSGGIHLEVE